MKEAVLKILETEETLEEKLDMLTAIGITTRNKELFETCESIRNEIVPDGEDVNFTLDDF